MYTTPNLETAVTNQLPPTIGDPSEEYIEATKIHRELIGIELPNVNRVKFQPEILRASWRASKVFRTGNYVELSDTCSDLLEVDLACALSGRRTENNFSENTSLTLTEISKLCWGMDGVTHEKEKGHFLRTAPSAGALYPRDIYLISSDMQQGKDSLPGGTWHFNPYENRLELISNKTICDVFDDEWQREQIKNSSCCFIVVGVFWRNRFKYNLRGTRFTLIEAGMVTQNLLLMATALGLKSLPFGGYYDEEICSACYLDGLHEAPLSVVFIGK